MGISAMSVFDRQRGGAQTIGRRRIIGAIILGVALFAPALAQAANEILIVRGDAQPYREAEQAIVQRLGQVGVTLPIRSLDATQLEKQGVVTTGAAEAAVVVAIGTHVAAALHQQLPASTTLVYCMVADPADIGLSDQTPVSGVTTTVPIEDQFALIARALPRARHVSLLYDATDPGQSRMVDRMRRVAPDGWRIRAVAVRQHASVKDAVDELFVGDVDVVWTFADASIYDRATIRFLLLSSLRQRVPVFGFSPQFVRAGAMIGVGVQPHEQGVQAADLIMRISAEKPDRLDVETIAPRFEVAVNLIVAKRLSIDVPQRVINDATYVFEKE
jgi:putative ABC transport system substrate-binding protein